MNLRERIGAWLLDLSARVARDPRVEADKARKRGI